jgi:Gluconolactonase
MTRCPALSVIKRLPAAGLLLAVLIGPSRAVDPTGGRPTVGHIERLDPRFDSLVPANAAIEVLAMGFAWSEGPVWVADYAGGLPSGSLLFSDIPNNRIHRWHPQEGLSVFLEPAGFTGPAAYGNVRGSNGLAVDFAGRLLCFLYGYRRLSVLHFWLRHRTLVDAWRGIRFISPNDLSVHASGSIYFTDPPLRAARMLLLPMS